MIMLDVNALWNGMMMIFVANANQVTDCIDTNAFQMAQHPIVLFMRREIPFAKNVNITLN